MAHLSSQEVEARVRQTYDAVNRGDLDAFLALTHPEVEFCVLMAESEGGVFRGHEGVREWWDKVKGLFSELRLEPEQVIVDGDRGYSQIVVTGTLAGVAVPQRMWQAFLVRDGLAVWWQSFRSKEEAIAALEARTPG